MLTPERYEHQAMVRVWRNVKRLGSPASHFGHAAVTLKSVRVHNLGYLGKRIQISYWPDEDASFGLASGKLLRSTTSDTGLDDKMDEMSKVTALRLEVGYRKQHQIAYPQGWDQMLGYHGLSPLNTPRQGQNQTGQTFTDADSGISIALWSQSQDIKKARRRALAVVRSTIGVWPYRK
jgi:hypothetical protein